MSTPKEPLPAFYQRTRRLAYYFAWASMALLALEFTVGSMFELYAEPRAAAAGDGWAFIHRRRSEEETGDRLLLLDAQGKLRRPPLPLADVATAMLPEDDGSIMLFFGSRFSVLQDGRTVRSGDLGQKWDVRAATRDWIFGWMDGELVGRRRTAGAWSDPVAIAKSRDLQGITASGAEGGAPLVAWHEKGGTAVKTAAFDGAAFKSGPEFAVGEAIGWDIAWSGGRLHFVTWRPEDRSFKHVTLRLECCPGCAAPLPPRRIDLLDTAFPIGRKITGLALAAREGRLRFFLTRVTSAQTAEIAADEPPPPPGSVRLAPLADKPFWRQLLGLITPLLMSFSALGMVCLGITLFRERGRLAMIRAGATPPTGPSYAPLMSRIMAVLLDGALLLPINTVAVELMDLAVLDPEDTAAAFALLKVLIFIQFTYYFLTEWLWGRSVGKWLLGLRVRNLDGGPPGFQRAVIRNVLRFFDASFGLPVTIVTILRSARHQRLGDMLAKTTVVEDR